MYDRRQPVFGGIAGGIFLIFLALAFVVHSFFLPLLFVGLAFSIFFGILSADSSAFYAVHNNKTRRETCEY